MEMTQRYKKAIGLDALVPSAELIEAAKAYKAVTRSTENAYRYRQLLIAYEESRKKAK